jgi:hypothetical protein
VNGSGCEVRFATGSAPQRNVSNPPTLDIGPSGSDVAYPDRRQGRREHGLGSLRSASGDYDARILPSCLDTGDRPSASAAQGLDQDGEDRRLPAAAGIVGMVSRKGLAPIRR